MTNYEKYKESVDLILQKDTEEILAFNKNTEEVAVCQHLDCEDCLFYRNIGGCYCSKNTMRWLVSEYKEPVEAEVDWTKVPVDTPVLVSSNKKFWYNRYFAGVDDDGRLFIFPNGRTSWSNKGSSRMIMPYKYIKLAKTEVE